jgi:hypothetical protein
MKLSQVCLLGAVVVACAAMEVQGEVVGMFWQEEGPNVWNLYAAVTDTDDTFVLSADLGDDGIDLPPDGVNNGLYSDTGAIFDPPQSLLTIGGVTPTFARPFTITPSGSGSYADASWFVTDGVAGEFLPDIGNPYTDFALWLGHFEVEDGAFLGGDMGGPLGDIQSRVFIGWENSQNQPGFGVFNIYRTPAPGSLALLALAGLLRRRRIRH